MADAAYPLPGTTTISDIATWENFFSAAGDGGVVPGVGSELTPTLDTGGRNIVIAPGGAMVRAFYKPVSSSTSTAIPAASGQNRIDRLVLRLDRTAVDADDFVTPVVIEGTPAASPMAPALTRTDDGLWDMPVCRWTSASTGGLTGLVDERHFIGAPPVNAVDAANATPQGRPGFLIERDTGAVFVSFTGDQWDTQLYVPDPWHSFTGFPAGWTLTARRYRFVSSPPNSVEVELETVPPAGGAGSTSITLSAMPAAYRPAHDIHGPLVLSGSGGGAPRFYVAASGTLQILGLPSTSYNDLICAHFTYPLAA